MVAGEQPRKAPEPPKRKATPRVIRAARITAIGAVLAALIGGAFALWKGEGEKVNTGNQSPNAAIKNSPGAKIVQGEETALNQSVQQSPGSTNIQAGRDVVVNHPPQGWGFTSERAAVFLQTAPRGEGRIITIKNNLTDSEAEVLAGRLTNSLRQAGWNVRREQFVGGDSPDGLRIVGTNSRMASTLAAALKAAGLTKVTTHTEMTPDGGESLTLIIGYRT